jgi:hypothetical protein
MASSNCFNWFAAAACLHAMTRAGRRHLPLLKYRLLRIPSTPEKQNPFLALLSRPPSYLEEPIGDLLMRHILLANLAKQENKALDAEEDLTTIEKPPDRKETSEAIMMSKSKVLVLTIGDITDLHG